MEDKLLNSLNKEDTLAKNFKTHANCKTGDCPRGYCENTENYGCRNPKDLLNQIVTTCKMHNIKITNSRVSIFKVLCESSSHPTTNDIFNKAQLLNKKIGIATVYRTLSMLVEIGLLKRHDFNNEPRYELVRDEHYHLIDLDSGKILEFHSHQVDDCVKKLALDYGYDLAYYKLEIYARKK